MPARVSARTGGRPLCGRACVKERGNRRMIASMVGLVGLPGYILMCMSDGDGGSGDGGGEMMHTGGISTSLLACAKLYAG